MIHSLTASNVGAFAETHIRFESPLAALVGPNGSGKTLIFNLLWFSLTGRWAGAVNPEARFMRKAFPRESTRPSSFRVSYSEAGEAREIVSAYDRRSEGWRRRGSPAERSLIVFSRADGSTAVWDPLQAGTDGRNGAGFVFTPDELWSGLTAGGRTRCSGLLRDVVYWKSNGRKAFQDLERLLARLSPPGCRLEFGDVIDDGMIDAVVMPTIRSVSDENEKATAPDVPVVHCGDGIGRILRLAYSLVWAQFVSDRTAGRLGSDPADEVVVLLDDADAFLEPSRCDALLSSLSGAVGELFTGRTVQVIAAGRSLQRSGS